MCHRHAGIPAPETLTPLKLENELQVCGFHTVIQEAIVSDFLKATGKYMHQVATDEFHGSQGNGSFWGPRLFPLAENETSVSVTERILLLEIAILCVYRPRYSMALPKPLKVFFM